MADANGIISVRQFASRYARLVYKFAPLPQRVKVRAKNALFRLLPRLFRHTGAYRNWLLPESHQSTPGVALAADETAVPPAPVDEVVYEACPPTVSAYLDDLFVRSQGNLGHDLSYVPLAADALDADKLDVKVIAFYLPQFHPIPENDEWWGKGFTDWTNVSKSVPQFVGHYQPHLPGELGFYDLRVKDVQRRQIELAKTYGIYGFCYHHYWFSGKRLLDTPFNQVLASPDLDLPFCLCWANENWTRRWDGLDQELLLAQHYSSEDDIAFIKDIEPALRDPRYIRVDGRPLLIVYRVSLFPDPQGTAQRWRDYCQHNGIGDLFLVAARSFEITDPRVYGFDAAVQFPPHQIPVARINEQMAIINPTYSGNIYDYREMARAYAAMQVDDYVLFRCVMPGWDNEARRPGKGSTYAYASPEAYADVLDQACMAAARNTPQQRLVFVNAWNEWAEGAHLEPDRRYGYAYLHTTANVLRDYLRQSEAMGLAAETRRRFRKRNEMAVVLHLYYEDLLPEIADVYLSNLERYDLFVTVKPDANAARIADLLNRFPTAYILPVKNRGRDVLPFLGVLKLVRGLGYELGCKIHTKKSTYRADGETLRAGIVGNLLGSRETVRWTLDRFRADPQLGLVWPMGSTVRLSKYDRNILNRKWLNELLPRLGRSDQVNKYEFAFGAGSMFWFRPPALSPLLGLGLGDSDFERELGQIDGTLAHAVERLFGLSAEVAGYRVIESPSTRSRVATGDNWLAGLDAV